MAKMKHYNEDTQQWEAIDLDAKDADTVDGKHYTDIVSMVDTKVATKVDKVSGKQLSTNDYTTTEKNKLAGVATGATKYTHPTTHPASMITGLHAVATSGSYNDLLNKPTAANIDVVNLDTTVEDLIEYHDEQIRKKVDNTGGTMTGILTAQSNTSYTVRQVRNMILSTTDAVSSSMQNGDIWIKYK